jgi:hypothetical protein
MIASQITTALKAAGKQAIVTPPGIASVYINTEIIYNAYGPLLQMIIGQQLNKPDLGPEARLGSVVVNAFFSLMSQVLDIRIALDLSEAMITANAAVNAKKGSALASFFADQGAGTSLAEMVGSGGFMTASGNIKGIATRMYNFADKMLATFPKTDGLQEVRESLSMLTGSLGDEFAFNQAMTPDGFVYDGVVLFKGDMKQIRTAINRFSADALPPAFQKYMQNTGDFSDYDIKESVRMVEGISVDRFTTTLSSKELDPDTAAAMKKLWGGTEFTGEYAIKEGKLFLCGGGKDYSKRLDALLSKAAKGNTTTAKPSIVFSIDFLKLMKTGLEMQGTTPPPIPVDGIPPISGTVGFSDTTMTKDLRIPLKMITSFFLFAQSAQKN